MRIKSIDLHFVLYLFAFPLLTIFVLLRINKIFSPVLALHLNPVNIDLLFITQYFDFDFETDHIAFKLTLECFRIRFRTRILRGVVYNMIRHH